MAKWQLGKALGIHPELVENNHRDLYNKVVRIYQRVQRMKEGNTPVMSSQMIAFIVDDYIQKIMNAGKKNVDDVGKKNVDDVITNAEQV